LIPVKVDAKDEFVVQPMLWGLVPFWFRGEDPKATKLTTNNARIEGLEQSKLYKPAVEKGQRCVVLADGFYEWKAGEGKAKQPYLIYGSQAKDVKIEDMAKCTKEDYSEKEGWQGPRLLYMAGLYSVWHQGGDEKKPVYSYTVITRYVNSSESSWSSSAAAR
jgi:putative SOS response-associated peptidase YedK